MGRNLFHMFTVLKFDSPCTCDDVVDERKIRVATLSHHRIRQLRVRSANSMGQRGDERDKEHILA